MRDNPQADDLLKIAEVTFRQEILPHLPADKKYTALMIANAMRIAARQFGCDKNEAAAEIAALSELLGQPATGDGADVLLNLNKQFAAAIRSGAFASGVGYSIWYLALPKLKSSQAAVVQLTVPVLAIVAGMVFLNEQITLQLMVASTLILGAVLVFLLTKKHV